MNIEKQSSEISTAATKSKTAKTNSASSQKHSIQPTFENCLGLSIMNNIGVADDTIEITNESHSPLLKENTGAQNG